MDNNVMKKIQKVQLDMLDTLAEICEKNGLTYFLVGGTLLGSIRHNGYIPWDDDIDIGMPVNDYITFLNIASKYLPSYICIDSFTTSDVYKLPFAKLRNINTIYLEDINENYNGNNGIWIDIFPYSTTNIVDSKKDRLKIYLLNKLESIFCIKGKIKVKSKIYVILYLLAKLPKKILNIIYYKVLKYKDSNDSKYLISIFGRKGLVKETMERDIFFPLKKHKFEEKEYYIPNKAEIYLERLYGKDYMELPPIEKRETHNPIYIKFEDGTIIDNKNKEI